MIKNILPGNPESLEAGSFYKHVINFYKLDFYKHVIPVRIIVP